MSDFNKEMISLLPRLRRFAMSLSRSPDKADDLVQITCHKAISAKESYASGTRMDSWLFRIMRNAWIDTLRANKAPTIDIDNDEGFEIVGQDGQKTIETRLMLTRTIQEIEQLPDDQREVITLVCIEELSYKEVSEITGLPIGTVMSRLSRARKKIASELGINPEMSRSTIDKAE